MKMVLFLIHLWALFFYSSIMITASSSDDGPPLLRFANQLPGHVDFSNSTGTAVECSASEGNEGFVKPSVSWIFPDGLKVTNITNLRQVFPDGRMVLSPFSSESFRQEVHAATYHCIATGLSGTILSSEVKIKAVMDVDYDANVYDVFAISGNTAVMKCHVPQFLKDYVSVVSFIKDDMLKIGPNSNLDSKYSLTNHGTLYIKDVGTGESGANFKCQTYNRLTKHLKTSSSSGKVIVTYPHGKISPKIADFVSSITVNVGDNVFLPCVIQGQPTPQIKWFYKEGKQPVVGENFQISSNGLSISNIKSENSGHYICYINNTFGSDQIESQLHVKVPLKVSVVPNSQSVDVGSEISLECKIKNDSSAYKIRWVKNGYEINMQKVQKIDNLKIRIASASLEDKGMYQCFVNDYKNDEQSQGAAQVQLGKFEPQFQEVFAEEIVQPGSSVAFTCISAGNPIPKIEWKLDGSPVLRNERLTIEERITADEYVMSTLTIKTVILEDGGNYACTSKNEVGVRQHNGRLNVYGPLKARKISPINVVAGDKIFLHCPVYGYPFDIIKWQKDILDLPIDDRQDILPNWTLVINDVQRNTDSGHYSCTAKNKALQVATANLQLIVMVLPKIAPFAFQEDLVREGMRAQIQCAVSEGDSPLTIQWVKDGQPLKNGLQDIFISQIDEFSSNLAIRYVSPNHNGNYTCLASNNAGIASHNTRLSVNALPKIIPFAFQDDQNFKGMRAHITCAVSQGDLPLTFHWLKDGFEIDEKLFKMGVQLANYDQYSSSLSIQSVTSQNSGNYSCLAINEAGKDSYTARLMVQVAPKIVPFNFQENNLLEGVFARVSCVVYQGDLPIQITWNKDGYLIKNQNLKGVNVRSVDNFTSILTIDKVTVEHSGNYSCVAKNSAASAVQVAQLVVKVPPKIVPFSFQEDELAEGTFVRVTCVVGRGDLPLSFLWTKDEGRPLPNSVKVRQIDDYSSVLSIDYVTLNHTGVYTCTVTNAAATTAYSSTLRVFVPPKWIKVPNAYVTALAGNRVVLSCEADGHPLPKILWTIKDSSSKIVKTLSNSNKIEVFQNGTLIIKEIEDSDTDSYSCTAMNGIGKPLSRITKLTVQVPVTVINKSHDTVVRVGQLLNLRCIVRGNRPINSSWTVNGKLLSQDKQKIEKYNSKLIDKEEKLSIVELTIFKAEKSDNGIYECKVAGEKGQDEATIKVTVEGPPEPPLQIVAVSKGDNIVEVTWKAPFDNHSPIASYEIIYETKGGQSFNRTTNGPETKIVLSKLQPSSTYYISIYARNAIGRSDVAGTVQIFVAGEAPTGVPESIAVHPQNGRSLRVSWQPPLRSTWNGAIFGYYVGYREAATGQPYEYHLLEIPEGYDKGLLFTLNELKEFTSYSVVVQAFNEHGKGPLSEEVLAMTSEGVPSRSPMAIDCSPTSSQTIVVNWEQPQEAYIHGILRGYKILYWTPDNRNDVNAAGLSIQNTTDIKITLRGLSKFANYSIQIMAYTFAGDGVASKPIHCHTLEDVPSAPRNIKVTAITQDSVNVAWSPPALANGIITHYNIYLQDANPNERLSKHRETRLVLNGNKTSHEVKNLRRGQIYSFYVTASTSIGEGASSHFAEIDLGNSKKKLEARITVFGETVKHDINKPAVLPCPATGQPTPKRSWFFRDETLSSEDPRITIQPDGALQITTLYHSDTGNYTCFVENEHGNDKITYELYVKVPPSAPSIFVTSTTFSDIVINWKTPSSAGNAPILGYTLNYKQEFGPWITIEMQPYLNLYSIENLQCGSTYQLFLVANNEVGAGQPSDTITATTAGGIPNLPAKEKLIEERTQHAIIHLDSWESNGCPILHFVIEYKQHSGRSWSLLSNELRPNRPSILLEKLQANTMYSLRMAAHTSAGSSVGEYEFSTLDDKKNELSDSDGSSKTVEFFSFIDFNVLVTVSSCGVVILLCVSVTCFWIKRHKKIEKRPSIGSTPSLRPRSNVVDDDDEISPYAMVKLSDLQKPQPGPSGEKRRPKSTGASSKSNRSTPQRFSNYIPTAPPMSESYSPHRGSNVPQVRKYPVLPGQTLYAMPNKERMSHLRSEPDGASDFKVQHEESTFEFPPPPPPLPSDLENQYDPPPPDMEWLCK